MHVHVCCIGGAGGASKCAETRWSYSGVQHMCLLTSGMRLLTPLTSGVLLGDALQVLDGIATKHNTSISNVAARWVLQRPAVPAVILGARNALHVPDHQQLFTFSLDDSDLAAVQEVLEAGQQPKGDCYTWERGGVF